MKKALKIIVDVLAWILLIAAMFITLLVFVGSKNNGIPNLFGTMFMSVQSPSMEPTFKQGDMILVKKVDDLYTLQKDDVITFYTLVDGARIINTHRIVEVKDENNVRSFITRGDNNPIDDTLPVYSADIIGKWTGTRLPGLGKAMDFLQTKTGFFVCVLIPIALFFIFELYKFIVALIETRNEAKQLSEEDEEEIKRKAVEEYLAAEAAKKAAAEAEAAAAKGASDATEDAAEEVADAAEAAAETVEDVAEDTAEAAEKVADASAKKGAGAFAKMKAIKEHDASGDEPEEDIPDDDDSDNA